MQIQDTRPPDIRPVGDLLREWRSRRRLSQMDLALDAEISTRHLSFLETGRARPSREMVLRLAEQLEVPLRERNTLLRAAGFAPAFPERPMTDPAMAPARRAVDLILAGHEPYPALAVDRHWTLLAFNKAAAVLMTGIPEPLLAPPVNVLRVALHPEGLAAHTVNYGEWRAHLLTRLKREVDLSADAGLAALLEELSAFPYPPGAADSHGGEALGGVAIPLLLRTELGVMSFISTTTVFGTPTDVTVAELALETFFPADDATAALLRGEV